MQILTKKSPAYIHELLTGTLKSELIMKGVHCEALNTPAQARPMLGSAPAGHCAGAFTSAMWAGLEPEVWCHGHFKRIICLPQILPDHSSVLQAADDIQRKSGR